jgi:ABC-type transport system involved in multi-copper enzyme maturation permease subunit
LLSNGIEMVLPNSVETRGRITDQGAQIQFKNSRPLDNPFAALFGRLDLVFIVSTLLALLVMIFTFDAIAGEKERRTLSLIMSNPVPRAAIITAKMAAGSSLLAGSFLAGTAAGVLLSTALGLNPFSQPGTWAPFAIGIGVAVLFLFSFNALGLLISGLTRSSVSAMITLLAVWVGLAMVLPKASAVVSKLFLPAKSQQVIDLEKSQVRDQFARDLSKALASMASSTPGIKDMSMDEYFKQRRAKNPVIEAFERTQTERKAESAVRLNAALDKVDADYERQKGQQATLARTISRVSPVSCFVHLLTELAGTGFAEETAWREARSNFKRILDRDVASKATYYMFGNTAYVESFPEHSPPAPKFPAEPVPLEKRLAAAWLDLVLLAIYGLLFFVGAHVAFLRYDAR